MRLLCLHGVGSSGSLYQALLAPLLAAADPAYEFVFVDGPVSCEPGPGVHASENGQFYSHTQSYEPAHMMEAVEHLEFVLDEDGPFDGIVGFSQGAALTTSYLHLCKSRHSAPAIKFALLFALVTPCSAEEDFGDSIFKRICPLDQPAETSSGAQATFRQILEDVIIPAKENNAILPDYNLDVYRGQDLTKVPRVIHEKLTTLRISLPTVHNIGKNDAPYMKNMSENVLGLYDQDNLKKMEHGGAHHPPQKAAEVKATLRAMEWAIKCARLSPHRS